MTQRTGSSNEIPQWLTLSEASDFLGVHYTTLRSWADNGDIPVFRTPGGHRRFSVGDLRRFLADRNASTALANSGELLDVAVGRVREQIQQQGMTWLHGGDEDVRDLRRERGRQLFGLAVSYVMKAQQRDRILEDGRMLGWEYGHEAALGGITLSTTGRAVQFFRNQLSEVVRDSSEGLDEEDLQIRQLLNHFLDEVLYAVLDGYEKTLNELQA
ncbi:MAG: helix-turn-helix domain-containing protein [Caldilineaceae bacterium]|nr:helix-turn-helix domain-containing protein [Caldilineaceae bacterium]